MLDENIFLSDISSMLDAISSLPPCSQIQMRKEASDYGVEPFKDTKHIIISVYKDPKSRTWWNYKLPGKPYSKQRAISKDPDV
jgi:hypothetical protein